MHKKILVREVDLMNVKPFIDVRKARVFRNIDHLTYLDGNRPGVLPGIMRDELNPDAGTRDIFNWILLDLNCLSDENNSLQAQDT